jgi:hypothetical protein
MKPPVQGATALIRLHALLRAAQHLGGLAR